ARGAVGVLGQVVGIELAETGETTHGDPPARDAKPGPMMAPPRSPDNRRGGPTNPPARRSLRALPHTPAESPGLAARCIRKPGRVADGWPAQRNQGEASAAGGGRRTFAEQA